MRHKPIPVLSRGTFNIMVMRPRCLCGLSCRFQQLSPSQGQVAYVLLTRSPLSALGTASDLHVLGTPPAFILSQDQTLHCLYLKTTSCLLDSSFFSLSSIDVFTVQFSMSLSPSLECPSIIPSLSPLCKSFFIFFLTFPFYPLSINVFFCLFI